MIPSLNIIPLTSDTVMLAAEAAQLSENQLLLITGN